MGRYQMDEARDRAIRLFSYLKELSELRARVIRTCDQYEKVLWLNEIPEDPHCSSVLKPGARKGPTEDLWVEVRKPRLNDPPPAPSPIREWLDPKEVSDSALDFPSLKESIPHEPSPSGSGTQQESERFRLLADHPEVRKCWESWVEKEWSPWAQEDRKRRQVQRAYADLFSIYQRQQQLGEAFEVVLGFGLFVWRDGAGHEIKRHLVVAQTSITFEAQRGVICVGPGGDGAKPTLEQDMLDPQQRPAPSELRFVEERVAGLGDDLWEDPDLVDLIKSWVHALTPDGQFLDRLDPPASVTNVPVVCLAPALILRKRTERSIVLLFNEIIRNLKKGGSVPIGVQRLVTIMDDRPGPPEHGDPQQRPGTAPEVYFPLPSNREQEQILEQLGSRQGVLVQGPPGTGKSHTIANLICHLLATGQRVLVTSHTARALRVLKAKLPEPVRNLCVLLLGNDLDALRSLEDSVRGITEQYNYWDPRANEARVQNFEANLDRARRKEHEIFQALRDAREAEIVPHSLGFGSYQGTLQNIAARLREEELTYSWLPERPSQAEETPLTDLEATELLFLVRSRDPRMEEAANESLDHASLLTPAEFEALLAREREAEAESLASDEHRADRRYDALVQAKCAQRSELERQLTDLVNMQHAFLVHPQGWTRRAAADVLAGREQTGG